MANPFLSFLGKKVARAFPRTNQSVSGIPVTQESTPVPQPTGMGRFSIPSSSIMPVSPQPSLDSNSFTSTPRIAQSAVNQLRLRQPSPALQQQFNVQAVPQVMTQAPQMSVPPPTPVAQPQALPTQQIQPSVAPPAPQQEITPQQAIPQVGQLPPQTQQAVEQAEQAVQQAMRISPEELSTQADIDRLIEATRKGFTATSQQAIPLEFITGQLAAIERRALDLAQPLESRLARLQAQRQASLGASKFALERADKRLEAEQEDTGEPFTLSEGQVRFSPTGEVIARGPRKDQPDDLDRVLSVDEATKLGVPFGTKASEAFGASTQTEEQTRKLGTVENALFVLDRMFNNQEGLAGAVGNIQGRTPSLLKTAKARAFDQDFETLKGLLTLENMGVMKGVLSDSDIKILQNASLALNTTLEEGDFRDRMVEVQQTLNKARLKLAPDGTVFELEGEPYIKQGDQLIPQSDFNQVGADTNLGALKQSIIQQESGGNYQAVGIPTRHGRALGRYQIIPKFHFQKIGLDPNKESDKQKFLRSPQLQDRLFGMIIDNLAQTYGNDPRKIAAAYYGGAAGAQAVGTESGNRRFQGGQSPSINEYVNQVIRRAYG